MAAVDGGSGGHVRGAPEGGECGRSRVLVVATTAEED